MEKDVQSGYRNYTMDSGVELKVPIADKEIINREQQECYQRFINVLSNIVTKYTAGE